MNPDQITLNFSPNNLLLLNFCLGFMVFGVSLDLSLQDFKRIFQEPKTILIGLISQCILLPALTFLLIYFAKPIPSMAMGLLLVAACPGGNVSNFLCHLAKANVALSVSLTTTATLLAVITTPFNFAFWLSFLPYLHEGVQKNVTLNFWEMVQSILLLTALPLCLGLFFNTYFPLITQKVKKTISILSLLIFAGFILMAFSANRFIFIQYIQYIFLLVFLHNGLALLIGYFFSKILGLAEKEARTIAIETGIQNAGLGLVLIFSFFNGLGGMAIIAAWWGIWHLISGLALASFWAGRRL